jgi:hypothetical protein
VRKAASYITIFMPLSLSLSCFADPAKEPAYSSEKPLYARVALSKDGSKVLPLVFDESGGTGEGYDTIYADLNFNGDLTDDKAIKGTLQKGGSTIRCSFPPIDVDVPYDEKRKGIENPYQVLVTYYRYERETNLERFRVSTKMRLRDEAGEWEYSGFAGRLLPAEKAEEAPVVPAVGEKPVVLTVDAVPDPQKERHLGIVAHLRSGEWSVSCEKQDKPIKARVQIRNRRGTLVHSEHVRLDKLFFGG